MARGGGRGTTAPGKPKVTGQYAQGTTNPFLVGDPLDLRPRATTVTGRTIHWEFDPTPAFSFEARLTLPEDAGDPQIAYTLTAAKPGHFAVAFTGSPEIEERHSIVVPQQASAGTSGRYHHVVAEVNEKLPRAHVSNGRCNFLLVVHPDAVPFTEKLIDYSTSRFGTMIRRHNGRLQPVVFAPVMGAESSRMQPGERRRFALLFVSRTGDWRESYRHVAEVIYGLRDMRDNSGAGSLNAMIARVRDYLTNRNGSNHAMWHAEQKYYNYWSDQAGIFKPFSPLYGLSAAIVLDDELFYRERALPAVEFALSRAANTFAPYSVANTGQVRVHSRVLGSPYVAVPQLVSLWEMYQRRTHAFRAYAEAQPAGSRPLDQLAIWKLTGRAEFFEAARAAGERAAAGEGGDYMDFLELHAVILDPRFLEAARTRLYAKVATGVNLFPHVPEENVTVDRGARVPVHAHSLGRHKAWGFPPPEGLETIEQHVPAWRTSEIGLESFSHHRAELWPNHPPQVLRTAALCNDDFLRTVARWGMVGRYANYAGDNRTEHSLVTERSDAPEFPIWKLTYSSINPGHAWEFVGAMLDYLITDCFDRSRGQIAFPGMTMAGSPFRVRVYGAEPGRFHDDTNVRLWMPPDLIVADNRQIDWLAGWGNGKFYIAFLNQSFGEEEVAVRFNPARLRVAGGARVRRWANNGPVSEQAWPGETLRLRIADAFHKQGIRFGLYYSTRDWYNPDYLQGDNAKYDQWYRAQIKELLSNYGRVDMMWYDSVGGNDWGKWRFDELFAMMYRLQPGLLVNNRVKFIGPKTPEDRRPASPEIEKMTKGDFGTSEGVIGAFTIDKDWESCMRVGRGWSYRGEEGPRRPDDVIRMLVSSTTGRGNLLLGFGPRPDGSIVGFETEIARALGAWLKKNGEAIYGTRGGPYRNGLWGGSCHKQEKLYLHLYQWRKSGWSFDPLPYAVKSARTLTGAKVSVTQTENAVTIRLSQADFESPATVVELTVDQPIKDGFVLGGAHGEEMSEYGETVSGNATLELSSTSRHDPGSHARLFKGDRAKYGKAFVTESERNPWAKIDLGALKNVKAVVLENTPTERSADGLILSVSSDGKQWEKVWQAEQWELSWTIPLTNFEAGAEVSGRKARYFKVETKGDNARPLILQRFTVYGADEPDPNLPVQEKLHRAIGDQELIKSHGRLADIRNKGPNPYLKGFPPPQPFNEIYKTALVRDAGGLLVKAESEYARADDGIGKWLQTNWTPAIRKTMQLEEAEIGKVRIAARPSEGNLNVHENIVYNRLGERGLVLDLYTPKTTSGNLLPVVIFVHGGGWLDGSHRSNRPVAMSLAGKGFAGTAVEYRLGREARFPAAVWDVKAAVRWVRKNAATYHLDPSYITVAGGSAGGNIVGLVGVTNGDPRFEGDGEHRDVSSDVNGIISLDGAIGEVSGNWTGGPQKDPWLHNEAIPLFHMIQRNRCPPLLFVKGGRPLSGWIKANIADNQSQHIPFRWPHAFECFDPSKDELVDLLASYLKDRRGKRITGEAPQ